jgi:flagellar biosynthesis/type III secretory pathway protein FliH
MEATMIRPVDSGEEKAYRKGMKHGIERGIREGLEKGMKTVLLDILHVRGILLNAMDRRQIAAETSTLKLRHWSRRAMTAKSAAEVFAH